MGYLIAPLSVCMPREEGHHQPLRELVTILLGLLWLVQAGQLAWWFRTVFITVKVVGVVNAIGLKQ